jgi:hypothetical protein
VWNTSSLVILTACYNNAAVFCTYITSRMIELGRSRHTRAMGAAAVR